MAGTVPDTGGGANAFPTRGLHAAEGAPTLAAMANARRATGPRLGGALLLIALAFLAALGYQLRQREAEEAAEPPPLAPSSASAVELDRFSARLEKSSDGERLTVGLRLRAGTPDPLPCFVFVVARSERGTPKQWAIWPSETPGLAISAGGHFHAAHPASGHPLNLTDAWERVDAVLPVAPGQPPFDSVVVYVVNGGGNILLSRPFAL